MKKLILILTFSLFNLTIFAQDYLPVKMTIDSDTTTYKYLKEQIKLFKITELNSNTSEFVFRSWTPNSVLEICKNGEDLNGKIIYAVTEVNDDGRIPETFVRTYKLEKNKIQQIYDLIQNSEIQNIPSDKFIDNWGFGFDGFRNVFETKIENSYSYKTYYSPSIQNLNEARVIINFTEQIDEIIDFKKYYETFNKEIPFIFYKYYGTSFTVGKIMTRKEKKQYQRNRKKKNNDD
jgi:hypothetical protein